MPGPCEGRVSVLRAFRFGNVISESKHKHNKEDGGLSDLYDGYVSASSGYSRRRLAKFYMVEMYFTLALRIVSVLACHRGDMTREYTATKAIAAAQRSLLSQNAPIDSATVKGISAETVNINGLCHPHSLPNSGISVQASKVNQPSTHGA